MWWSLASSGYPPFGFILHRRVMEHEEDVDVAIPMVTATHGKFPDLVSRSFDKGFYSPANQKDLPTYLDTVILPKKGRLSAKDREREALVPLGSAVNPF